MRLSGEGAEKCNELSFKSSEAPFPLSLSLNSFVDMQGARYFKTEEVKRIVIFTYAAHHRVGGVHKNGRIVAWCLVEREAAVTGYRVVEEYDGGLQSAFVKNFALGRS